MLKALQKSKISPDSSARHSQVEAAPVEKADEGIIHTCVSAVGPGQSCLRTNLSKVLLMREVRRTDLKSSQVPGSPRNFHSALQSWGTVIKLNKNSCTRESHLLKI